MKMLLLKVRNRNNNMIVQKILLQHFLEEDQLHPRNGTIKYYFLGSVKSVRALRKKIKLLAVIRLIVILQLDKSSLLELSAQGRYLLLSIVRWDKQKSIRQQLPKASFGENGCLKHLLMTSKMMQL